MRSEPQHAVARFDDLTRRLDRATTRREVLRLFGTAVIAALASCTTHRPSDKSPSTSVSPRATSRSPRVDVATVASIEAAQAAVLAGATQVALSSRGRLQYHRVITDRVVRSEEIQDQGVPVARWTHSDTRSVFEEDYDKDGLFERRSVATRGMTSERWRLEVTSYSPGTRRAVERLIYTFTEAHVHVEEQQPDGSGNLKVVNEYDRPVESVTLGPIASPSGLAATGLAAKQPVAAPCDLAKVKELFREGVDQGLQCLHRHGASDLELRVTGGLFRYIAGVTFECASLGTRNERILYADTSHPMLYPIGEYYGGNPSALIRVNTDKGGFFSQPRPTQLQMMFHEAVHLVDELRQHDPNKEVAPNRDEVDRVYACAALCFSPPGTVSQCTCATCLGTTKCDTRCDQSRGYRSCPDDFGAWCPCPTRLKWYPSCQECLVRCPSGLACFGFSFCVPVNKGLCAPEACP